MRYFFSIFPICLLVFLSLLTPLDASAQREAKSFGAAKPLPNVSFMDDNSFRAQTKLIRNKSPNDAFLGYEIRVPSGWTEVQQQSGDDLLLSLKLLNSLIVYESPIGQYNKKSRLQVQAIELQKSISPEQWLLDHLLSLGYHVEHMGIYSKSRAEALIAYIKKGQNYVERAVVEINGSRALLLTFSMPIEAWSEMKSLQAQVVDSFELLNEFEGRIDNTKGYDFLDVAHMRYPMDWSLRPKDIDSADRMVVNVLNVPNLADHLIEDNEVDGRVEVQLVSHYATPGLGVEVQKQRNLSCMKLLSMVNILLMTKQRNI